MRWCGACMKARRAAMNEEQGLKNVIDYIEAHIRESLSAEEIASACYYSRSNTKALFKKVFQYGMMEYAARRKLTQAAGELLSTSQSVCEIALEYGFASQEVFTRAFKKNVAGNTGQIQKKDAGFGSFFPDRIFSVMTAAYSDGDSVWRI